MARGNVSGSRPRRPAKVRRCFRAAPTPDRHHRRAGNGQDLHAGPHPRTARGGRHGPRGHRALRSHGKGGRPHARGRGGIAGEAARRFSRRPREFGQNRRGQPDPAFAAGAPSGEGDLRVHPRQPAALPGSGRGRMLDDRRFSLAGHARRSARGRKTGSGRRPRPAGKRRDGKRLRRNRAAGRCAGWTAGRHGGDVDRGATVPGLPGHRGIGCGYSRQRCLCRNRFAGEVQGIRCGARCGLAGLGERRA